MCQAEDNDNLAPSCLVQPVEETLCVRRKCPRWFTPNCISKPSSVWNWTLHLSDWMRENSCILAALCRSTSRCSSRSLARFSDRLQTGKVQFFSPICCRSCSAVWCHPLQGHLWSDLGRQRSPGSWKRNRVCALKEVNPIPPLRRRTTTMEPWFWPLQVISRAVSFPKPVLAPVMRTHSPCQPPMQTHSACSWGGNNYKTLNSFLKHEDCLEGYRPKHLHITHL